MEVIGDQEWMIRDQYQIRMIGEGRRRGKIGRQWSEPIESVEGRPSTGREGRDGGKGRVDD